VICTTGDDAIVVRSVRIWIGNNTGDGSAVYNDHKLVISYKQLYKTALIT